MLLRLGDSIKEILGENGWAYPGAHWLHVPLHGGENWSFGDLPADVPVHPDVRLSHLAVSEHTIDVCVDESFVPKIAAFAQKLGLPGLESYSVALAYATEAHEAKSVRKALEPLRAVLSGKILPFGVSQLAERTSPGGGEFTFLERPFLVTDAAYESIV